MRFVVVIHSLHSYPLHPFILTPAPPFHSHPRSTLSFSNKHLTTINDQTLSCSLSCSLAYFFPFFPFK